MFRLTFIAVLLTITVSIYGQNTETATEIEADSAMERALKGVDVVVRRPGMVKSKGTENGMTITGTELLRAACCNLGESFTTNPSIDASYSDAATGTRRIRLLGLSGQYVQMMTENVPSLRGAAIPYSLGYVPGPWMESIQVSKGSASVKNGYESITGQINVEFLKPQTKPSLTANIYMNSKSRFEANAMGNLHLSDKWSSGLMAHYEDAYANHDGNSDGFLDMPRVTQYHLQNRWAYISPHYIFQTVVNGLNEKRKGGQRGHNDSNSSMDFGKQPWLLDVDTKRYEAFTKNAFMIDSEHATNIALILSSSFHDQKSRFGIKEYDVIHKNLYASLLFESEIAKVHSISTGLSLNTDNYNEHIGLTADDVIGTTGCPTETTIGAYAQYTFNPTEHISLMGGLRVDHSNVYGTFVTPRAHVKYEIGNVLTLRGSVGKGYRSVHALAENSFLLASGRKLVADNNNQEVAWNYGVNATLNVPLAGHILKVETEYYLTDFKQQTIIDYDSNPHVLYISKFDGTSRAQTFQVEASYTFNSHLNATAAYRLNRIRTTYGGVLMSQPLVSASKSLFTASYKPGLGLWQFDVTFLLNGGGRMPEPYKMADGNMSWDNRFKAYEQLQMQVTRFFRHFSIYAGGENLTGKRQHSPIISADNPWSDSFDATMVWGPVEGGMFYIGTRLNI